MFFYNIINIQSIRDTSKVDKHGDIIKPNDNKLLELLIKLCSAGKFDIIVVDEFHKANNHKSQQGKGMRELCAKYKIALSGTPITKRIEKSWNMLNWMGLENAKYWIS
jgi:SNF2 family DNA or RNA helicase